MTAAPNFLRPHEVESAQEDLRQLDQISKRRELDQRLEPQSVRRSKQSVQKRLQQEPPELNKQQEDKAAKRIGQLEEELKVGMLSQEEMRRNPPGAAHQHLTWETQNKAKILEWKNLQLALYRGMTQTEAEARLNIARLRPRTSQLNMEGAQIPRTKTYSQPISSEAWERIFGSGDKEKDALKAQLEDLQAELAKATEQQTAPKPQQHSQQHQRPVAR